MSAPPGGWSPVDPPQGQSWQAGPNPQAPASGWQQPAWSQPSVHDWGQQQGDTPGWEQQPEQTWGQTVPQQPTPPQTWQQPFDWGQDPSAGAPQPPSAADWGQPQPTTWSNPAGAPAADQGWGNAADWGTAPPAPLGAPGAAWQTFKPGIVTLKPLGLGDVIGGAAKLLRWNPKGTILLTLVVQLVGLLIAIPLTLLVARATMSRTDSPLAIASGVMVGMTTAVIPVMVAQLVLFPLLHRVTLDAVVGRKTTMSQAWETAKGRVLASIGVQLLLALVVVVLYVAFVVAMVVVFGAAGFTSDSGGGVALAFLAIFALGAVLLAAVIYVMLRLYSATPLVVWENIGPIDALKRSWKLTNGNVLRAFGYGFVVMLLMYVISLVIGLPLQVISSVLSGGVLDSGSDAATGAMVVATILSTLQSVISGLITTPFQIGAHALFVIDLKMRQEGYDMELLNAAQGAPQP